MRWCVVVLGLVWGYSQHCKRYNVQWLREFTGTYYNSLTSWPLLYSSPLDCIPWQNILLLYHPFSSVQLSNQTLVVSACDSNKLYLMWLNEQLNIVRFKEYVFAFPLWGVSGNLLHKAQEIVVGYVCGNPGDTLGIGVMRLDTMGNVIANNVYKVLQCDSSYLYIRGYGLLRDYLLILSWGKDGEIVALFTRRFVIGTFDLLCESEQYYLRIDSSGNILSYHYDYASTTGIREKGDGMLDLAPIKGGYVGVSGGLYGPVFHFYDDTLNMVSYWRISEIPLQVYFPHSECERCKQGGYYKIGKTQDGGVVLVGSIPYWSAGFLDVLITRLDSSGMPLWSRTIGSAEGNELGLNVLHCSDGSYWVVGMQLLPHRGFIAKLDSSGNLLWAKAIKDCKMVTGVWEFPSHYVFVGADTQERLLVFSIPKGGSLCNSCDGGFLKFAMLKPSLRFVEDSIGFSQCSGMVLQKAESVQEGSLSSSGVVFCP